MISLPVPSYSDYFVSSMIDAALAPDPSLVRVIHQRMESGRQVSDLDIATFRSQYSSGAYKVDAFGAFALVTEMADSFFVGLTLHLYDDTTLIYIPAQVIVPASATITITKRRPDNTFDSTDVTPHAILEQVEVAEKVYGYRWVSSLHPEIAVVRQFVYVQNFGQPERRVSLLELELIGMMPVVPEVWTYVHPDDEFTQSQLVPVTDLGLLDVSGRLLIQNSLGNYDIDWDSENVKRRDEDSELSVAWKRGGYEYTDNPGCWNYDPYGFTAYRQGYAPERVHNSESFSLMNLLPWLPQNIFRPGINTDELSRNDIWKHDIIILDSEESVIVIPNPGEFIEFNGLGFHMPIFAVESVGAYDRHTYDIRSIFKLSNDNTATSIDGVTKLLNLWPLAEIAGYVFTATGSGLVRNNTTPLNDPKLNRDLLKYNMLAFPYPQQLIVESDYSIDTADLYFALHRDTYTEILPLSHFDQYVSLAAADVAGSAFALNATGNWTSVEIRDNREVINPNCISGVVGPRQNFIIPAPHFPVQTTPVPPPGMTPEVRACPVYSALAATG